MTYATTLRCLLLAMLAALGAGACGGDDAPPMMIGADAPPVMIDAPEPCQAQMDYGSPMPTMELAERDADTMPETIYYEAAINADPMFDAVSVELYKGFGTFETGEIEGPRVIGLTGPETNYATCGACVFIYTDWDEAEGQYNQALLAQTGTLNLMSVSPNIKGKLTNVTFVRVSIDPDSGESSPIEGCSSRLTELSFDFPITTSMARKRGGKRIARR